MQDFFSAFGKSVREKRRELHLTQTQLALKLGMCNRTIIQLESGKGNAKFETIVLVAKELNVSIDASIFGNTMPKEMAKCVSDFFSERSELESQFFIDLCKQAEKLKSLSHETETPLKESTLR